MKLTEDLNKLIAKALELKEDEEGSLDNLEKEPDLIQCVIKVQNEGNGNYTYLDMIEDNCDYASEYDMQLEYQDADLGHSSIEYILAYHNEGENVFYDEVGELLDIDMEEQEEFEKAYQDANNSLDNTVIPDKDIIESVNKEVNEDSILASFEAATQDVHDWAYKWSDMDQLFMYADNEEKPFNASEEEVVKVLRDNGENIASITQEDINEFIEDEVDFIEKHGYTPEDLQELVNPNVLIWMSSSVSIQDVIHDTILEGMI